VGASRPGGLEPCQGTTSGPLRVDRQGVAPARRTSPHLPLAAGAVLLVGAVACREVPQAPTEAPPSSAGYESFQLDAGGPQTGDIWIAWWNGVTLLLAPDQSVHVVAQDYAGDRLVYYGCANVCEDKAHWFGGTVATSAGTLPWSTAVLTPSGIVAVYGRANPGVAADAGVWFAACPGACNFPGNWRVDTLFAGRYAVAGPSWGAQSTSLASDSAGVLHLLLTAERGGLFYGRCASGCGSEAGWQVTPLDSTFSWTGVDQTRLVAVDPRGGVHVLYSTAAGLTHASCAGSCASRAAWQTGVLPGVSGARALSLAFDRSGGLHLAYTDSLGAVTYATCGGPCTAPGAWSSAALPLRALDVSLAVGRTGAAYLATTDQTVALSRCEAGCLDPANWRTITVDSAAGGGPGHVSVAVDSLGRARIASTGFPGSATTGFNTLQYTSMLP
jgi:hypothetical protein